MIDRVGNILRIAEMLEGNVIRCESNAHDGPFLPSHFRKADGETYDDVRLNDKGKWEWSWAPSGPGKKRTGRLRFCDTHEIATEEQRLKRNRDALEATTNTLQRWVPELTHEQALDVAKKPRFMRDTERQKLAAVKDAGEFMALLLEK